MKKIIFILAVVFLISDCNADARVLEQLKAKRSVSKNKQPKKKINHASKALKAIKAKQDIKPKQIVTSEELDIRNNLAYLPKEDKPFTGKHEKYHPNKKKYVETNYKDGKKDGLLIMWDENEHKIGELNFINGQQQEN